MLHSISMIGTTSAGKSTIGNLLAGHYVLPTGVQETTTSVVEIRNDSLSRYPVISFSDLQQQHSRHLFASSDHELRALIAQGMHELTGASAYISLRLELRSPVVTWRTNLRHWVLGRARPLEDLKIGHGFAIRDFPGFQHERDSGRAELIARFLGTRGVILFVFNAEETDSAKEDLLLRALFSLLRGQGQRWERVVFVLNRKDAFLRDGDAEKALRAALRSREERVRQRIQEVWGVESPGPVPFVALAAGPALATELLWWRADQLGEADREHLLDQLGMQVPSLLPDDLSDSLPRAATRWSTMERYTVFQHIYQRSGLLDLVQALKSIARAGAAT